MIYGEFKQTNSDSHVRNGLMFSDSGPHMSQFPPNGGPDHSNYYLPNNKWYHIFYVRDGSHWWTYVNGILYNSNINAETYTGSTSTDAYIGARVNHPPSDFPGYIKEIAIWYDALDATEINELYNSVEGTNDYTQDFGDYISSNDLGAHWKFNEGTGNTLNDYSGNNYHGIIYGASWVMGGCTDPNATNYDETANVDYGSCEYSGCTNPSACNYDADATEDDGSCLESDCAGECGGGAIIDGCGVCEGDNSDMDCAGECFGDAVIDECGECGGDGTDCNGDGIPDDCEEVYDEGILIGAQSGDINGDGNLNILDMIIYVEVIINQ